MHETENWSKSISHTNVNLILQHFNTTKNEKYRATSQHFWKIGTEISFFCNFSHIPMNNFNNSFLKEYQIILKFQSLYNLQDVFFLKKKRWQTAILANIGFIIAFGIRCNFGAAKGRMISNFTDPFGNNHVYIYK